MTQIRMLLMVMLSLLACPINKACDVQLMRPGLCCDNGNSNGDSNGDGTPLPHSTIDDEVTSPTDAPPPGTMITSKNGASNMAATMMTGTNVMDMFTDLPQGNGSNGQGGGSNDNNNGSLNGYNRWNGRVQTNYLGVNVEKLPEGHIKLLQLHLIDTQILEMVNLTLCSAGKQTPAPASKILDHCTAEPTLITNFTIAELLEN